MIQLLSKHSNSHQAFKQRLRDFFSDEKKVCFDFCRDKQKG